MANFRFSQSQKSLWIIPLAALILLSVAALPAQTITLSEPTEEAALPSGVRVDLTVLQVTLSPDHPMGMSLGTEEIGALAQEEGLVALSGELAEFGEVSLLYRGEAAGLVGDEIEITLGGEVPYVTTLRSEDGSVTQAQGNVRDGLHASFRFSEGGEGEVALMYTVDLNWARPIDRQSAVVIERTTVEWEGTTPVDLPEDCTVGRAVRVLDERLTELLFILQVSE
jgi:hypothetical protein